MLDPRDQVLEAIDDGDLTTAERLLAALVVADPVDPDAWLMLTLVRADLGDGEGAGQAARGLLQLAPGHPRAHWAAGVAAVTARDYREAERQAGIALDLADDQASAWALLARVHAERGGWEESLASAEKGLAVDPEHVPSANYRALALRQLGRHAEADAAFEELAAAAPLSAFSNAGRGWALLRQGARADAEESFREALRLEPDSTWARDGLLTAIKAKNPVYRALLKYFDWMELRSSRERTVFAIGGLVVFNLLRAIADARPAFGPLVWPAIALYALFLFSTGLAEPVSNLALMANPRARRLLGTDRRIGALAVAGALSVALGAGIVAIVARDSDAAIFAIPFLFLLIPIAAAFQCPVGWARTAMVGYAGALAACALASFFVGEELRWALFAIVAIGSIAASWITRILIGYATRRRRASGRRHPI